MATELLRPGVSVIQEFRTVSPTIVTPTLVPCAIAPAFQVLDALATDATGNKTVNTDAVASVPAVLTASLPGVYNTLDGKVLKVSVNNGAIQEFTFSDPTAVGLSAAKVADQINSSSPAPAGFGAYTILIGASYYLQLRSTGRGDGQYLKVLNGDANASLGFADNFQSAGISNYQQYDVHIEQLSFPDPRGIIDELDVDESSIRVFVSTSGSALKEFKRDESFLRKYKGATYTSGTITYGSFNTKKFAFQYKKGDVTHEFTFASEPVDLAALVIAMNTLATALTGLTFSANPDGVHLDAKSTFGYFEVISPTASSAHPNLGWTDLAKAYTVEPVDDGDGDTRTPFIVVDQENFNAPASSASLTGTGNISVPANNLIHNKTLIASLNGGWPQEVMFDAGPIPAANVLSLTNTLNGEVLAFTVNGVAKTCTFVGTDPLSIAVVVAQINAAAGLTVCYRASDNIGTPSPSGTYLAFQVGGETAIPGGEIVLNYTPSTPAAWTDLGLTGVVDLAQVMSQAEIVTAVNATFGAGFAVASGNFLKLNSTLLGEESKVAIGNGTANTLLGFTNGQAGYGSGFAPKVGDGVYVDGTLIGYVSVVMPGGYNNRLKLDREVLLTWGGYAIYIEALNISSTLPADRPTPNLVIDSHGAVNLKQDFLRDTEGNPIVAQGALVVSYKALRLDVTPKASNPGLLNIEDTTELLSALAPINTDNPLALMLYFMSINAPGIVVTGIGVDETSSLNPDGTAEGFGRALTFLEAQEVYALAPSSQDPIVHQICMTHVDSMSEPDAKGERIVFINPEMPLEGVPAMINSGTDGESTGVLNEFDTKLPSLAADLLAAGIDPTNIQITDGVYLDISSDAKKYNIASISGMKVQIRVAFAPGENDDGFYSTSNLSSTLLEESYTLYKRGENLVDTQGLPDYDKIAQAYQDLGMTYLNRRVVMVAPEYVGANIEATEQKIKGYYLCAAIAGMCGQQPPQQGFTNFPITGFTRPFGSNDVFNNRQMNVGAAGGTYWVLQEVKGGPLTCRHQLTTDLTSIETRELSITKVVDFTAKFMRAGLRNFIGKFNITQPFLDTLSTVVQGQLSFLTESGVLIGGDLNNIIQDKNAPDTVLIDVTLDVPYPCNYIRLTLVV